jgi:hypothetical protein
MDKQQPMKTNVLFPALLALLTLYSCDVKKTVEQDEQKDEANTKKETPIKMIEYLVGEWELESPSDASQPGSQNDRLIFTEEARYIVESGNQKIDSGAYRMNEQLRNLYFESETNERPREYEFEITENTMTLKPKNPQSGEEGKTSYTYRRIGQPSISPEKTGKQ